jgi:hypothetical protein
MERIKKLLITHELKLALTAGFFLVALTSFQFGKIESKKGQNKPIVIEKPAETVQNNPENAFIAPGIASSENTKKSAETKDLLPSCTYIGSKSSNKVHLPTCRYAKSIKPENMVCFKNLDDALKQGRLVDKNCIK